MLSRRDFITRLVSLAAVSVLPSIVLPYIGEADEYISANLPKELPGGKLTFGAMMECYQCCCFGKTEPDSMVLSPSRYKEFSLAVSPYQRFSRIEDNGFSCLVFDNASVTWGKRVPDDTILVFNSKLDDPRYSGKFRMPKLKQELLERAA
jgi:hypothetical protein